MLLPVTSIEGRTFQRKGNRIKRRRTEENNDTYTYKTFRHWRGGRDQVNDREPPEQTNPSKFTVEDMGSLPTEKSISGLERGRGILGQGRQTTYLGRRTYKETVECEPYRLQFETKGPSTTTHGLLRELSDTKSENPSYHLTLYSEREGQRTKFVCLCSRPILCWFNFLVVRFDLIFGSFPSVVHNFYFTRVSVLSLVSSLFDDTYSETSTLDPNITDVSLLSGRRVCTPRH